MKQISTVLAGIITLMLPGITNAQNTFPQNGAAGIGTANPDPSSILEMKSATKGMLIPRMTKTDRDAIASPAAGLMIYQTNNSPGFYYYDGANWKPMVGASKSLNNLTGPTAVNVDLLPGSNASSNLGSASFGWKDAYLNGTIFLNGSKFISRPGTYNTFIGELSGISDTLGFANTGTGAATLRYNTSGNYNTAHGYASLQYNTTGVENSAIGSAALFSNTIGNFNTAVGSQALTLNTNGSSNTSIGAYSLYINSTGFNNTASGTSALYSNTSGYYNTANGSSALKSNTIGNYNSAIGSYSLFSNTTGSENTAVGRRALYFNKTANYNTALGNDALYNNTDGYYNTATGYQALYKNTSAVGSTAFGYQALYNNTGKNNTGTGFLALFSNTTGILNTAGGSSALSSNTTGAGNTAFGTLAGFNNDNNNFCSFFGYDADQSGNTDLTNSIALGNASRITASNQVRIGNSSITSIGGYANWTNISDGRFKKNIKQNVPGLAFINKLKPVTYNLDVTSLRRFMTEGVSFDNDGKRLSAEPDEKTKEAIHKKEETLQTGFVAQDVEKAAKELGYDFSGVDKPENDNSPYGLRYSEFVVPLVKAVQELSQQNDELKKQSDAQQQINAELQKQIDELKGLLTAGNNTSSAIKQQLNSQTVRLEQNQPNPTSSTTVIKYFVPEQTLKASLKITNANGQEIKLISLSTKNYSQITLQTNELTGGTYFYSLIVDGKTVDTKKMVIAH